MDKSKKFDSLADSQIVYEYISALPFKEALRKIEGYKSTKLRFDSFDETDETSIYSIVITSFYLRHSYGYQLRLKPWNDGEHTHVALHKVDYHHDHIDYNWTRFTLRAALLIIVGSLSMMLVLRTVHPLMLVVIVLAILLLIFSSNEKIGRLAHSPNLENLILGVIQAELGEASDDNIIDADENEADLSASGSHYESQA